MLSLEAVALMSRRDLGVKAARRDLLDFGVEGARARSRHIVTLFGRRDRFTRGYLSTLPEGS